MEKYHIRADKSLGQNFLIDDDAVNGIIEAANVSKDDLVIENTAIKDLEYTNEDD